MKLLTLAYNQNLKIQEATKNDCIFMLTLNENIVNHIQSIHAAAIFSLGEATSVQFLINIFKEFENNVVPLLRSTNTKYKRPAFTNIYAKAVLENVSKDEIKNMLLTKKRALVTIKIEVLDENNFIVFIGYFDWFLSVIES